MTEPLPFLTKTVNAWETIPETNKMLMLIGYSYTGRSTFAELIKKYQFGIKNDSLIFEKDKYTLENVISSKSIKVQTTIPVLYRPQNLDQTQGSLSIVDVPAYCLTPETKKWTAYEQKLTWTLMSQKQSEVGFLLFIQQKNTRSNITAWNKTLLSFLDMYRQYPSQLLNSVGWVITKCAPDLTEDAMSKRLQQMQQALRKQKNIDADMIDKLFNNILQNKRYFIFRKCSGTQAEQEEIKTIYRDLNKNANYRFKGEHLKEISWTAEENNLFNQYIEEGNSQFTNLFNFVNQCLLLQNWDEKSISSKRQKHLKNIPRDLPWVSKAIADKLSGRESSDLPTLINAVRQLMKFCELTTKEEQEIIKIKTTFILDILAEFPFFFKDHQEENEDLFQFIRQTLNFKKYLHLTKQTNKQPLLQFFNKLAPKFCEKLIDIQTQNDNEAFYEACMNLIENVQNLKLDFSRFLQECKSNVLKFRNSKQLLQKVVKDLENTKDQKKIVEFILKIANTLQKEEYFKEAGNYYKLINCPGDAIFCLQKVENDNEEQAKQLINYMAEHYLFESAKKTCYVKATKFHKSRAVFGKLLGTVLEAERKFIQSGATRNILLQQIQVSNKDIEGVRREVAEIAGKLKV